MAEEMEGKQMAESLMTFMIAFTFPKTFTHQPASVVEGERYKTIS